MTLKINDDGSMSDMSGEKIHVSDVQIAIGYLDKSMKAKVLAWWRSQ